MPRRHSIEPKSFRAYTRKDIDKIPELGRLSSRRLREMKAVSHVLPFRTNPYVVEELIDWDDVPNDPMFQLTFPQGGMLDPEDLATMVDLVEGDAPELTLRKKVREIQDKLNPHPAGQMQLNVPTLDGEPLPGMQHKYRETVLFFPSQGQTCHAYCTYCFRWAQFVGIEDLKFAAREAESLVEYVRNHREVRSVLFTGGDPMIMKTQVLRRYIEPLLAPGLEHLVSIRIGTKAPSYWPHRFLTDSDTDDLMRLFEEVRAAGKHVALMAHYTHPRELSTKVARQALRRIISTGTTVRCQSPIVRHVNNSADAWARMWRKQVRLGAIPYYMFVERNTGAKAYFEVPLAEAYKVFNKALRRVSGLGRTVRGPSMSATPGKVVVDGITEVNGEKVFVLKFLQGRDPKWSNKIFFARYDPVATWLDELKPAFGESEFFFAKDLQAIKDAGTSHIWDCAPADPGTGRRTRISAAK